MIYRYLSLFVYCLQFFHIVLFHDKTVCSTMLVFVWLEYIYRSKPVIDDETESDDEAWGQWYTSKMKDNLEKRLECNTNEDDRTYDDYDADSDALCQLAAFLMWSAPLIAAVTGYVFACLLRLLSVATFEALHHDNEVSFAIYSLLSRFDFLLC